MRRHQAETCWCCPLAPWTADTERWLAFCAEVDERIDFWRGYGGIDSSTGDRWRTFERPFLPMRAQRQGYRLVGRLMPIPTTPRDAQGRWESGGLA